MDDLDGHEVAGEPESPAPRTPDVSQLGRGRLPRTTTTRLRLLTGFTASAIALVAIGSIATKPAHNPPATGTTSIATGTASTASTASTVDTFDTGCLDHGGSARHTIGEWYPEVAPRDYNQLTPHGVSLNVSPGAYPTDATRDPFLVRVAIAIHSLSPGFTSTESSEDHASGPGCVTRRFARFRSDGENITILAMRVDAPTSLDRDLAHDSYFNEISDAAVTAQREFSSIVVVAASDGTSVLIGAYASDAGAHMYGWPTTMPARPSDPRPAPVRSTTGQLLPIAQMLLQSILAGR